MSSPTESVLSKDLRLHMLRTMLRIRAFEDRVAESYLRGMTAGSMFHLSVGEEAAATGMGCAMKGGDWFTTHHRGHGIFIARGADLGRMFAEVFGRIDGYCKGKGGSMHIADVSLGHMGANAIVGANIPISLGGALSMKYQGLPQISVAFFGDGALNQGVLYESMNMAALWRLPVVFAVVNNQYGMGTRIDRASASLDFTRRAETFGVHGVEVDGMDVEKVWRASQELFEACRAGAGPGFIIANAYRFYGHGRKDPSPYRSQEEEQRWRARDPIEIERRRLVDDGVINEGDFDEMKQSVAEEIERAVAFAAASPEPRPEELFTDVFVNEEAGDGAHDLS